METPTKLPFYVKAAIILIGICALITMLSVGKDIILPLIYAMIIAVSISPAVNFMVRKKINRVLAISFVLLLGLLIVTGLIFFVSSQTSHFSSALPKLTDKFQELINQAAVWASGYFNISVEKINYWITTGKEEFLNHSSAALGSTLGVMGFVLAAASLTIVYICMILFYQTHLLDFVHKLFGAHQDNNVSEILGETKGIIQSYLSGLFAEFAIVTALNAVGLLILGIDYAIVLGIIGGLLNVIPFIGGIIGVALFVIIALVTKAPVYVLYVIALHMLIQFVDNHYIVPKIVGSKVKLNAFICLIAVIAGELLWGIPGMFLSIPLTAIIKLILDRIETLKPWGFLLGSAEEVPGKMKFNFTIKGFIGNFTSKQP